jgi:predicted ATPase
MARFLESITLQNILSFGPEPTTLALEDVNVLAGANGSGKSNLVAAINLLRHAPREIAQPLREGGGVQEWLWRPRGGGAGATSGTIGVVVGAGFAAQAASQYQIQIGTQKGTAVVLREWLRSVEKDEQGMHVAYFHRTGTQLFDGTRHSGLNGLDVCESLLAQRKDPISFAQGTHLGENLDKTRVYQHWTAGPLCPLRASRRPDTPTNSLLENLENFPSRIATLKGTPAIKRRLLELIKDVSPGFDDIEVVPEGGALQLYLIEGDRKIASYRLSDGTLRYLMLLAILLDPTPPPLIVIEEPELSLHPDVLPTLRDLMLEAAERTQLIVTTQSPTFLDAWTDHASAVVVCEREGDSTTLRRLDPADFPDKEHGLGGRWVRGEIGGTRW